MLRTAFLLVVLAAAVGCSRGESLACQEDLRYQESTSLSPLQVPDDLTVPDETDALRVPGPQTARAQVDDEPPCIESPPRFFEPSGDG
jgi:uncharacterized lipoprotein